MLIPSPRHTPADLAHWRALEAQDALHFRTHERRLRAMAARSVEYARAFAAEAPCYLGVSWGKDSVLLASLVVGAGLDVPLVCVEAPAAYENPHNADVRARVPWGTRVEVVRVHVERGSPEHYGEHGRHDAGYALAAARYGDRYLSGVRAAESYARTMRLAGHGVNSARTSAPLSHWSTADVFAWSHGTGLPLHPSYAMTAGGRFPREHLRVSSLGHLRGAARGQREWEIRYYRRELEALGLDSRSV